MVARMELEEIWAGVRPATEEESLELVYAEIHKMREEKRADAETSQPAEVARRS
jgi:hypothetical protein